MNKAVNTSLLLSLITVFILAILTGFQIKCYMETKKVSEDIIKQFQVQQENYKQLTKDDITIIFGKNVNPASPEDAQKIMDETEKICKQYQSYINERADTNEK